MEIRKNMFEKQPVNSEHDTEKTRPGEGGGVQLFCEYILKIGIQNGDKHCFRNFVAFTYVNDIKSNEIENSDFFLQYM